MKEKELEKLEKLKEQEKLPKNEKQEIRKATFNNFINSISILILLIILMVIPLFAQKEITIIVYKITSMVMILFSIFLFEVAYKKDNGMTAIGGVEMLVLSTISLFAPYRILND